MRSIFTLLLAMLCTPATAAEAPTPGAPHRFGKQLGLVPIANFSSDSHFTFGVLSQYFDYGDGIPEGIGVRPFQSLLTVQTSIATQGPRDAWVSYERYLEPGTDPTSPRILIDLYGMQTAFARHYGLGPRSMRDATLESQGFYFYDRRAISLEASVRKKFPELHSMDLQAGIRQTVNRAESSGTSQFSEDFGPESITETTTQVLFRGIWERRNSEFIPSTGWFGLASLAIDPLAGWSRIDLDHRRYFKILDSRRLWLASQLRYTGTSPDAPLHEKARLGSLGTLRGLPLNRFVSNHSASFRNELRSIWFSRSVFQMPLKIGTGIYADLGKLSDTFGTLQESPLQAAWGISFFSSYFTDDFLGSADFGFSKDSRSLYLRLGHAF